MNILPGGNVDPSQPVQFLQYSHCDRICGSEWDSHGLLWVELPNLGDSTVLLCDGIRCLHIDGAGAALVLVFPRARRAISRSSSRARSVSRSNDQARDEKPPPAGSAGNER